MPKKIGILIIIYFFSIHFILYPAFGAVTFTRLKYDSSGNTIHKSRDNTHTNYCYNTSSRLVRSMKPVNFGEIQKEGIKEFYAYNYEGLRINRTGGAASSICSKEYLYDERAVLVERQASGIGHWWSWVIGHPVVVSGGLAGVGIKQEQPR